MRIPAAFLISVLLAVRAASGAYVATTQLTLTLEDARRIVAAAIAYLHSRDAPRAEAVAPGGAAVYAWRALS